MNNENPTDLLFIQDWWWQAVSSPKASLRLQTAQGAFWPLAAIRRLGLFKVYSMPPLTQHSGPYLSDRKDFLNLLTQLSTLRQFHLNVGFRLNEEECRLAERLGMRVYERHSYRIENISDTAKVFAGIKPAQQRQIRKAERSLKLQECDDIEELIKLQAETFKRRNRSLPYHPDTLRNLYAAVKAHDAGKLLSLVDRDGHVMACGLFVHDQSTCYSLVHGFHKTGQNLGAGSLLQWEGIRYASRLRLCFDFEGSDIKSIARFNSSFGAIPETYSRIERYSPFFRFIERLRRFF